MNRRVMIYSKVKDVGPEPQGNQVLIGRMEVICCRPETEWASHEQVEVYVRVDGGPNEGVLQNSSMTCG
jgi:hypothetical protein